MRRVPVSICSRSFVRACSSRIAVALISESFDCRSARRASRSPSRSDTKYCESVNPPTAAAMTRTKMKITGPRRVFFVIGWPRSRSFISLLQEMRS